MVGQRIKYFYPRRYFLCLSKAFDPFANLFQCFVMSYNIAQHATIKQQLKDNETLKLRIHVWSGTPWKKSIVINPFSCVFSARILQREHSMRGWDKDVCLWRLCNKVEQKQTAGTQTASNGQLIETLVAEVCGCVESYLSHLIHPSNTHKRGILSVEQVTQEQ